MAIGKLASIAARAAKKALATRKKSLGTIRNSRADRRVESAGVTRILPRSTSLAKTSGTKLATTGRALSKTAGTRVGTARPMRNVTPRANSRLRGALTDAAAVAGLAGIIGGAYLGNKPKKTTPVVPSAKKKPSTPSRHTSKITKPPAGLKKATRPTAKKAPAKKAVKKASPKKRVSRFDPMSQKKLKSLTGKNKLMYRHYLSKGGTNKIIK